ncbi:MAG: hypothetical protein ABIN61_03095 [candidate division WOR-3 bacterium]
MNNIILFIIEFNLFVSSSMPMGVTSFDLPSGFSLMVGGEYKINYDFIASFYNGANYKVEIFGIALGKEFFFKERFGFFPEMGIVKSERSRESGLEKGLFPIILVRFFYSFPKEKPCLQIGFSLREVFNGKMDVDFLDLGLGFEL